MVDPVWKEIRNCGGGVRLMYCQLTTELRVALNTEGDEISQHVGYAEHSYVGGSVRFEAAAEEKVRLAAGGLMMTARFG